MTAECASAYTLQWDAPSPSKLPLLTGDLTSGPLSNTWFPEPTRVLKPNSISIGAAVFAGLTSVTDRLTYHATRSVTIRRMNETIHRASPVYSQMEYIGTGLVYTITHSTDGAIL